jgi:hypothetical protein
MASHLRALTLSSIALAALISISCGASVDAVASLEPVDVVTGWYDDGIIEGGKNKLVPSITMKLRNKTDKELSSIQINAIFRRVGEQEMWGEYFGWAIPRTGAASRRRRNQDARDAFDPRLHRRAAAHADAAEQGIRRREGRDLSEAGIEGPGQARRVPDPATAAHAQQRRIFSTQGTLGTLGTLGTI